MGHRESSPEVEVHLPQETRKTSNKQSNPASRRTRKNNKKMPRVSTVEVNDTKSKKNTKV